MMQKLYKVLEFTTTGWEVPGDEFRKLTKEVASEKIEYLLISCVSSLLLFGVI